MNEIKEIYISVDVEADGPIPSDYSLTSLGAAVAGFMTSSGEIVHMDSSLPENQFYAEMKPISDQYDPAAFAVGLFVGFKGDSMEEKRTYIERTGEDPAVAMTRFAEWINERVAATGAKAAVFAAYPLGYDWMWTYWYLVKFSTIGSPFGHSRHIDIKTEFAAKSKSMISRSIKRNIPAKLKPKTVHTHMALDDAIEQGELLINIMKWEGK